MTRWHTLAQVLKMATWGADQPPTRLVFIGFRGGVDGYAQPSPHVPTTTIRANLRSWRRRIPMFVSSFLLLFIVLLVAWVLGSLVFHVAGGLIHLLLVVAVISLIVHFVRGRP
jgi:hypothetical protein